MKYLNIFPEPNFVTSKKIQGEVLLLKSEKKIYRKIKNKIILIENADPGFDWIFTKGPKGLITKYGGIASHMAIRCSEFGLPAAIGCGEILYEKLKFSKKVSLNCKDKEIFILDQTKSDEYLEEKKLLKTLGYMIPLRLLILLE